MAIDSMDDNADQPDKSAEMQDLKEVPNVGDEVTDSVDDDSGENADVQTDNPIDTQVSKELLSTAAEDEVNIDKLEKLSSDYCYMTVVSSGATMKEKNLDEISESVKAIEKLQEVNVEVLDNEGYTGQSEHDESQEISHPNNDEGKPQRAVFETTYSKEVGTYLTDQSD
ncbi:hypothetical protein K7X08_016507 [Anisodus acutangulus]|uniref:Uncharacterized protein n=1 Tax=Anisodus acutangulus TaxID=402998 RepID=A0A9Q1LGM6_9SOLA|nr:hypothetical protein K7X08_016507 [Anisodus acutangulus]